MNNYNSVLILHALDKSTSFLSVFRDEFKDLYFSFDSNKESIDQAKLSLGNLEPKSLIIYLGHGSSSGLYEPDESHAYEKYFLDAAWGNYYFEDHDVFILSCKSNDYVKQLYKPSSLIGFGNIISSKYELDRYNEVSKIKLCLEEKDINRFNEMYVNSSLKIIRLLLNNEICFFDVPKYLRFMINKEINQLLLDKSNIKRIDMAKLLFDFRNEFLFQKNSHSL